MSDLPYLDGRRVLPATLFSLFLLVAGVVPAFALGAAAPPIRGVVTDTAGVPLSNVRVVLAAANRGTTTAADGSYLLRSVPPGEYHLDISLIGYAPEHVEVTVPESGPDVIANVQLRQSPLTLEGIIVTGTVGAADPLTVTQSTTQLSGKELDRQLGSTIAETLAGQPGISSRYGGPAASVPVIRGLTGDRVLMLQNGQRTGDLAGTSSDHAASVDPLAASRVEVVRGPASLLYGSSALGGVVNVIGNDIPTNVPNHIEGFIAAQGETATPGGAATAEAIFPLGSSLAVLARGGFRDADDLRVGGGGKLDNTFFENLHGDAGLGYIGEIFSGGAAFNAYGFRYGLPAAPDAEEAGVHIEGARYEATARGDWVLAGTALRDIKANASAQWYTHDEIEPDGEIGTTFKLNTQTADLRANTGFFNVRGTIGASGLFRQYEPTGEEALTPDAISNSGGIFLFQEVAVRGLPISEEFTPRLQFGARYDLYRIETSDSEDFGAARALDFDAFSGSAGLSIPFSRKSSAGFSVARAFRAPTVEELFSNAFHAAVGTFDIGNPNLEAETNLGIEGVVRAQTEVLNLQFSAYYNQIDNYITPNIVGDTLVAEEGETFAVPLNVFSQQDASIRGIEGKVEAIVAPNFVLGAMGDVIDGQFRSDAPLPFLPSGHLGGTARWDDGKFSVGGTVRRAFAQNEVPENEFATPAYTLIDLSGSYSLTVAGRVNTLTLRADNVLDERYREATSRIKDFAPNPGRNLSLVYRVLF